MSIWSYGFCIFAAEYKHNMKLTLSRQLGVPPDRPSPLHISRMGKNSNFLPLSRRKTGIAALVK